MAKIGLAKASQTLRAFALAYPEAVVEFPWEHAAVKVRGKTFVFLPGDQTPLTTLNITVKLPISAEMALTLPFTEPTGYGLGRSGWVTASFETGDAPPMDMLKEWIDQSFRAVAPKKLSKKLPPRG